VRDLAPARICRRGSLDALLRISWTKDAKGFYYSRYPEPPKGKVLEAALSGHALYYHRVGTTTVRGRARLRAQGSAGWIINRRVSEDGRYLLRLMFEGSGNNNRLYVADLGNAKSPNVKAPIKPVIEPTMPSSCRSAIRARSVFLRPIGKRAESQGDCARSCRTRRRLRGRRSCRAAAGARNGSR
jgi:hypothetical protein